MITLYSKYKVGRGGVILDIHWNYCTNKATMTFTKLKWTTYSAQVRRACGYVNFCLWIWNSQVIKEFNSPTPNVEIIKILLICLIIILKYPDNLED